MGKAAFQLFNCAVASKYRKQPGAVHTAVGTWELNEKHCDVARNRRSLWKEQEDLRVCCDMVWRNLVPVPKNLLRFVLSVKIRAEFYFSPVSLPGSLPS